MTLPIEIIGLDRPDVTFVWEDGHRSTFNARDLRLRCRCALCIEEMTGRPLLDPSRVPADLIAVELELVGGYGVRISFSDGHSTGIFKFRDLHALCAAVPSNPGRA